jgi:hypothetical protein
MATQAQIEANRRNARKSTGPKSQPGKDKTRFNGLKHGLRAEHVVLPGEDPAQFEAERQGWIDDWRPRSHTRAVLVERAAAASWRLRRSVRAEADRLRELAEAASDRFVAEGRASIERAIDLFQSDPRAALMLLRSDAAGVDQFIAWWDGLDAILEEGPAAWDLGSHARLMVLLGHPAGADPAGAGRLTLASARLLAATMPGELEVAAGPLAGDEAEDAIAELLGLADDVRGELREVRARLEDPSTLRRRAINVACVDTSREGVLRHRYEMAHDRSLRATLKELIRLARSGADVAERPEEVAEPAVAAVVDDAPTEANPGTDPQPRAPTEANSCGHPNTPTRAERGREGPTWAAAAA